MTWSAAQCLGCAAGDVLYDHIFIDIPSTQPDDRYRTGYRNNKMQEAPEARWSVPWAIRDLHCRTGALV